QVDDQRRALLRLRAREAVGEPAHRVTPRREAIVPMSLSPRPETLTMTIAPSGSDAATFGSAAIAWALSSAHRIPSVRARRWNPASASVSVTDRYLARPVSFRKACSGPTPG